MKNSVQMYKSHTLDDIFFATRKRTHIRIYVAIDFISIYIYIYIQHSFKMFFFRVSCLSFSMWPMQTSHCGVLHDETGEGWSNNDSFMT